MNRKKVALLGVLFALFVAIFLNYSSLEHLLLKEERFSYLRFHPFLFSFIWSLVASLGFYVFYHFVFRYFYKPKHRGITLILVVLMSVGLCEILGEVQSIIRDLTNPLPRPPRQILRMNFLNKGLNSNLFKNSLIAMLNLLMVYIQNLLYENHLIERRNEQLKLERVKNQLSNLVQHINPHFFFNSLNTLRYTILSHPQAEAIEFLDNLTLIFRKTLKITPESLHTLEEELEIVASYSHIIEKRFPNKIEVDIEVKTEELHFKLTPLSLLTLLENVIKHNKLSEQKPIKVKIYTSADYLVIENNIVTRFEPVESNGIGLINLNKQYELLTKKGIIIEKDPHQFRVKLPLLSHNL